LREQGLRQRFTLCRRHADFKAVFTGIAGAGDEAIDSGQFHAAAGHERLRHFAGSDAFQRSLRAWPLQRQQRKVVTHADVAAIADVLLQMRNILRLAGGIHHHVQIAAGVEDHQIIKDAALLVGEQRVTLLAGRNAEHVHRHQCFQRFRGVRPVQLHLPHVRDVEQPGVGAGVQMLLEYAKRILHRHVVASKGHHACAKAHMQVVQRGAEKFL